MRLNPLAIFLVTTEAEVPPSRSRSKEGQAPCCGGEKMGEEDIRARIKR